LRKVFKGFIVGDIIKSIRSLPMAAKVGSASAPRGGGRPKMDRTYFLMVVVQKLKHLNNSIA
jgi:hypothetical protein